jgi:hypothetical protein
MTRLFVYILVLSVFFSPAMAQSNRLSSLPDVQSLNLQTYASQSTRVEKIYKDDDFITFTVDLPNSFKEQDMSTLKQYKDGERLYGEVYRANGIILQDVYPYFSLKTYPLKRVISAKNWFIGNILKQGHTLRAIKSDKKGDNFEALYVRFDELGNTEIVRTKGYLKGPRVIMAEYVLPTLLWNERRDYQTYAIKSFSLKGRSDNQRAEPVNTYKFLETFTFQYPISWRMVTEKKDLENRIDVSLLTADDLRVVFANLDITLTSDQSLKDDLDRSRYETELPQIVTNRKQAVLDQGYLIDDVMERREYDVAVPYALQLTEVYPLRRKLSDYQTHRQAPISHEFWITVIKGSEETGKNYIISMLIPARKDNIDQWSYAVKAYELILESIR